MLAELDHAAPLISFTPPKRSAKKQRGNRTPVSPHVKSAGISSTAQQRCPFSPVSPITASPNVMNGMAIGKTSDFLAPSSPLVKITSKVNQEGDLISCSPARSDTPKPLRTLQPLIVLSPTNRDHPTVRKLARGTPGMNSPRSRVPAASPLTPLRNRRPVTPAPATPDPRSLTDDVELPSSPTVFSPLSPFGLPELDTDVLTPNMARNRRAKRSALAISVGTPLSIKKSPRSRSKSRSPESSSKRQRSLLGVVRVSVTDEPEAASSAFKAPPSVSPTGRLHQNYDQWGFRKDSARRQLPEQVLELLPALRNDSCDTSNEAADKEESRVAKWQQMIGNLSFWQTAFPITLHSRICKGVPVRVRRDAWLALSGVGGQIESSTLLEDLLALGPSTAAHQIRVDIERTFTEHALFEDPHSKGRQELSLLLNAYAHHNASVVYCQGMSYVAGVLLVTTGSTKESFLLLDAMINNRLHTYYHPTMSGIIEDADIFGLLLKENAPRLAEHLNKTGIHPLMYITQWFLTMFTTLRCWETSLQAFDLFFARGTDGLFLLALAILLNCEADILALPALEFVLPFLQNIPPSRSHPSMLSALLVRLDVVDAIARLRHDYVPTQQQQQSQPQDQDAPSTPSVQRRQPPRTPSSQRRELVPQDAAESLTNAFVGFWRTFATPIRHRIETTSWRTKTRVTTPTATPKPPTRAVGVTPKPSVRTVGSPSPVSPTFHTPNFPDGDAANAQSVALTPRKLLF